MQLAELEDKVKEAEVASKEVLEDETIEQSYLRAIDLINEMAEMMLTMREHLKRQKRKTNLSRNLVTDSGSLLTDAQLFIDQAYGS